MAKQKNLFFPSRIASIAETKSSFFFVLQNRMETLSSMNSSSQSKSNHNSLKDIQHYSGSNCFSFLTGWMRLCLAFTGFYRVLPGFTGFYRVLLGFTGLLLVLLGFTEFYWVLLGFTGFYGFLWVLLGFFDSSTFHRHSVDGNGPSPPPKSRRCSARCQRCSRCSRCSDASSVDDTGPPFLESSEPLEKLQSPPEPKVGPWKDSLQDARDALDVRMPRACRARASDFRIIPTTND